MSPRCRPRKLLSPPALLAALLALPALIACHTGTGANPAPHTPAQAGATAHPAGTATGAKKGLTMRLSEGTAHAPREARPARAQATRLSLAAARRLLSRLPALAAQPGKRARFRLRKSSRPPPRTGKTVAMAFPPRQSGGAPPPVAGAALEVRRHAPDGDVPIAPHLSITFSQPMVAVTPHAASVAGGVPVVLTPKPPGSWQWIGTRTLLFQPEKRFPQATRYRVTIPAGTRSATGGTLARAVTWSFSTPAPKLERSYPTSGAQPLRPLLFALFDQKIDAAAVLPTISIAAGHGRRYRVRAATAAEIAGDDDVARLVAEARKSGKGDRFVAFRPIRPLPAGTDMAVTIGPGTPSAEGPRKTTRAQSFSFSTHGPLRVLAARCAWGTSCPPLTPWYVRFSNPLDADAFDRSQVSLEPKLADAKIDVAGNTLLIRGDSRARTTYKITLHAGIKDTFGQTLARDRTVSIHVGPARPGLWGPSGLVVLDPAANKPTLSVFSSNHKRLHVRAWSVEPKDWPAFVAYMKRSNTSREAGTPPGRRFLDETIAVAGDPDAIQETAIDLSRGLHGRLGHVIVVVQAPRRGHQRGRALRAWVEATHIGLDAFADSDELLAWTTSLADGKPIAGATVTLGAEASARTGAGGTATLPLPKTGSSFLVARSGNDTALLPQSTYWWSREPGWTRHRGEDALRWFVFDDRGMYRPGESVHLKGWIRRVGPGARGDIEPLAGAVSRVSYKVLGPRGNDLGKGVAALDPLGGFHLAFALPKTPNLGYARVRFTAAGPGHIDDRTFTHEFQIQEFRRPAFEVKTSASPGPYTIGDHVEVTAKAAYYAGGGLANAGVRWLVTSQPTTFTPPNRGDFTFGTWRPWWMAHARSGAITRETFRGKTDATGADALGIDLVAANPPQPMRVVAQATVTDVNRQAWSSQTKMLVHPSDVYVGLKTSHLFVDRGAPIDVDAIAVDQDGAAVPRTQITLTAVRLDWKIDHGVYKQVERNPQRCVVISADKAKQCRFASPHGGEYKVTATAVDDHGRPNRTELSVWVAGGARPPARKVEQEQVTLVPDRKSYQPGQRARLLVEAPFYPAEGLLTVRRSGIVSSRRFRMTGPTTTVAVPIADREIPNVHVEVDLVGAATRTDDHGNPKPSLPKRPAYALGTINLPVPPISRSLQVKVSPRARRVAPGAKTAIDVAVTGPDGRPVKNAAVAVVVVDEAVLALSNYHTPDPIAAFYAQRPAGVNDALFRQYIRLARPHAVAFAERRIEIMAGRVGGGMANLETEAAPNMPAASHAAPTGPAGSPQPIALRTNFSALAAFSPVVKTDAAGRARVKISMPDNLTRYRVMAVAAAGARRFGSGESSITARRPLMVRPSPPRFLNWGDRFELPVVLQNQTDRPLQVDVAVRATNAAITAGRGRRVTVAANDRVEVEFPAKAEMPGTARFQVVASAGRATDAAEVALPVWTPATTEAFATYGTIARGAIRQPVAVPKGVVTRFGGVDVSTSSTELQSLTDAFLYLVSYPFECAEQVSSRVMAVAALRGVLSAFHSDGLPPPKKLEASVSRDIAKLRGVQNADGGFSLWASGETSQPYVSIYVAHALTVAGEHGFVVPPQVRSGAHRYLAAIDSHIPAWYPPKVRRALIAYALYVRHLMGDADAAAARELIRDAGLRHLPIEAVGWLYGTLAGDHSSGEQLQAIRRYLQNRVSETASTAAYASSYSDGGYLLLHSSRRADAIILDAMLADQPQSDLVPKLARGLLAHRVRGRWENTQENAFVLLALARYFRVYEQVTPDFVARVWLGRGLAGAHRFRGRTRERARVHIPMAYLAAHPGARDLILGKRGKGRLYYRIGMTYAPKNLDLAPSDHGFVVARTYQATGDPHDVVHLADGSWRIRAGARVRVRLTMVAPSRRYHVALVDHLPAGLEPLNPSLAVTGEVPRDPKAQTGHWWWLRPWYEHQDFRDDRVEAFASLLWAGVHTYSYVARATTPGTFVAPPAKAEEMYAPETFGRSGTDHVIVK